MWKYVRDVGLDPNFAAFLAKTAPQNDINSTNITCGRLAFDAAERTEIADVVAGTLVGFKLQFPEETPDTNYVYHEGPVQMYMSRPESGNVKSYRGDGEWFKVAYWGPESDTVWVPLGNKMRLFNFTVPQTTPPGQYLLRIEQFMPSFFVGYVQSYIRCAQINVIGPGGGSPESAGTARFPGTYTSKDPGIVMPDGPTRNLLKYKPPGPAVWTG